MSQHQTQTAATRQLRLVADRDARPAEKAAARAKPALAVWPLLGRGTQTLPRELARQLTAHYSDPGALVLTTPSAADALRATGPLGRRILALNTRARTSAAASNVTPLRAREHADLAIATLTAAASTRTAAKIAVRVHERLKPGGFLVLALDGKHGPLGGLVRACQKQGLQYWQHIVALDPRRLERADPGEAAGDADDSLRCHRDLLVFRRPAQVDVGAREAASAQAAA